MVMRATRTLYRLGVFLFLLGACLPSERSLIADVSLPVVDTLLRQSDTVLAQPSEVTTDDQGRIWLTDWSNSRFAILDSTGHLLRIIGRDGSGPGEFHYPTAILPRDGRVRVVDARNGRQQLLDDSGTFISSMPLPPEAMSGNVSLHGDGGMLVSLNGADSALARRYAADGEPEAELGHPVAPGAQVWNFSEIKQEIRDGRVPGVLRNLTIPVLAPDGSSWLALVAEGEVQHYAPDDSLLWSVTIDEPVFDTIRAEFFDLNNNDSNPGRLHSLSYFSEAFAVGNDLWLLVRRQEHPATILVLDQTGSVKYRIHVPDAVGISGMALDAPRRRLYLLAWADATLLRVDLPGELVLPTDATGVARQ